MTSTTTTLFDVVLRLFFATLIMTVHTEPTTTQGIQLMSVEDVRFPLTVSQCEPVVIYYSINPGPVPFSLGFYKGDVRILALEIPTGTGYLEWICNIPAGYDFTIAVSSASGRYYIVQPGLSSSCLRNITTTYEYASYRTTAFESYTRHPPALSSFSIIGKLMAPTVPYTLGSFPTITVNPELAVSLTTSTALSSESVTAPLMPLRKSGTLAIAGGIVGGVIVMTITAIIFAVLWRRRNSQLHATDNGAMIGTTVLRIPHAHSVLNLSSAHWDPTPLILSSTGDQQSDTPSPSNLAAASDTVSRLYSNIDQLVMPQNTFVATLDSFSQLNPEERLTFVSALSTLMALENPGPAGARRAD